LHHHFANADNKVLECIYVANSFIGLKSKIYLRSIIVKIDLYPEMLASAIATPI